MVRIPMTRKLDLSSRVFALILCGCFSQAATRAQNAPAVNLKNQLDAQYKMAKTRIVSGSVTVTEPGTVLVIQKERILAFPPTDLAVLTTKYEDGKLSPPGAFVLGLLKSNPDTPPRPLQVGEKVYPIRINVNLKTERIQLAFIECDTCNGVTELSSYQSELTFQYPKGFLETAGIDQVQALISQVLTIDTGTGDAQQQSQDAQGQQAAPPPDAPPQPPATIQMGQTLDEVKAILGQPDKMVDLGPKQIYVYKDLKITFSNGKVADVE